MMKLRNWFGIWAESFKEMKEKVNYFLKLIFEKLGLLMKMREKQVVLKLRMNEEIEINTVKEVI